MKQWDTFIHGSRAYPAFVIIGLLAVSSIIACSAWRGQHDIDPRDYQFHIHSGFNGIGRFDTLYATLEDSVFISAYIRSPTPVFRRPGHVDLDYSIDFGDGSQTRNPYRTEAGIAQTHLYKQKGVYQIRVWGAYNGTLISADTVYAVVQDYVRPLEATRMNITVTGIERNIFHSIERPGKRDSTYLTMEKDFAYSIDAIGDIEFLWEPFRGLYISELQEVYPNGRRRMSTVADCVLLADGSALHNVQLNRTERSTPETSSRQDYTSVTILSLPLKKGMTPTRRHAVYEATFPVDSLEYYLKYGGEPVRVAHDYKVQSGDTNHIAKTIHFSPYSDVTITVEFTK